MYYDKIASITGQDVECVKSLMDKLDLEYGIKPRTYFNSKFYELTEAEQLEKAEDIRLSRKYSRVIARNLGIDRTAALNKLKEECAELKIPYDRYVYYGFYNANDSKKRELLQKIKEKEQKRAECLKSISKISGWDLEVVETRVSYVENKWGISPQEFLKCKGYEITSSQLRNRYLRRANKRDDINDRLETVSEITGRGTAELKDEIKQLKQHFPDEKIDTIVYMECGLYELSLSCDYDIIAQKLKLNRMKTKLMEHVADKVHNIYKGLLENASILNEVEAYMNIENKLISDALVVYLTRSLKDVMPEIENNDDRRRQVALDIVMTRDFMEFTPNEYTMYRLFEVDFEDRLDFISNSLRKRILYKLSSKAVRHKLVSKIKLYRLIPELFMREIVDIEAGNYDKFIEFCKRHDTFVKKDNYGTLGKGIEKVEIGKTPLRTLYERVSKRGKYILLEELIDSHESMSMLNPSSVNTVRIIVVRRGNECEIVDAVLRIGRDGAFLDNGAAGGIIAHIDEKEGIVDSTGATENGLHYFKHPDHGYRIEGFTIPDWDSAMNLAKTAIMAFDGLNCCAWDLAYTKDKKWVIVEGNTTPQFTGQTNGVGMRRKFLDLVGYNELFS